MPRPRTLKPKYCHHKSSGRAFVLIDGKMVYLGEYGTQESRDAYDRVIGEWIAKGRQSAPAPAADAVGSGLTITELVDAFWTHAQSYYVNPDVSPSAELDNFRLALRPLKRLYGPSPAAAFGPLALKAVRAEVLKPRTVTNPKTKETREVPGWSRTYTNRQIARLKQVFKWAAENELVPASVHQGLAAVAGLRKGRGGVRETAPVRPSRRTTWPRC